MNPDNRVQSLQLELPPPPKPAGLYKTAVLDGPYLITSGHGPYRADGTLITGRLGEDLDRDAGYRAARQVGLAILATIRAELGSLDRVGRVIKILGLVNSTPDFPDHPRVINGCSELFRDVWGDERGVGARSAVGMVALPGNIAVEIEAMFRLAED